MSRFWPDVVNPEVVTPQQTASGSTGTAPQLEISLPPGYTLKKTVRKTNRSKFIEVVVNPEVEILER